MLIYFSFTEEYTRLYISYTKQLYEPIIFFMKKKYINAHIYSKYKIEKELLLKKRKTATLYSQPKYYILKDNKQHKT